MKTKILLLTLSLFLFCPILMFADASNPTALTDRFLIDSATKASLITTGRIKLKAVYKSQRSKQERPFEENSGETNESKSGYGWDSSRSSSKSSVFGQSKKKDDTIVNQLGQLQKKIRGNEEPDPDQNNESPEKSTKHFNLWPFYAVGSDTLLSVMNDNSDFSYYFSEYDLDKYDLSFYVKIDGTHHPVELVSLFENLALWKIQGKLKTGLSPLNPAEDRTQIGQIVSITASRNGEATLVVGNVVRAETNGSKFWISPWSTTSLPNVYIVRNLDGQVLGIPGSEDQEDYPCITQITKKQINNLLSNGNNFGKMFDGGIIGLIALPLTHAVAERMGIEHSVNEYIGNRVIIWRFLPEYLARAGFNKGDIIYKINRAPVYSPDDIRKELGKAQPGDTVLVEVLSYHHTYRRAIGISVRLRNKDLPDILLGLI